MWAWDSAHGQIEAEANKFASFLLMPTDDFRVQTAGFRTPTVRDFEDLRQRYAVSLTASILKWLDDTSARAMLVISRNGFIDWSRSSKPLLESGVFFRAKQAVIPLPDSSLAARQDTSEQAQRGVMFAPGAWWPGEEVFESVVHSEYHGMGVSLLVFPNEAPDRPAHRAPWLTEPDGEEDQLMDVVTRLAKR